jgi:high-affinity nickel-transport protein
MIKPGIGRRIALLYAGLIAANLAVWAWALVAFADYPVLLGTALLAYSLGLRHGVDADHIAAIDNATRKLMQGGKRPVLVGLSFALGHSTVVVLAALGIAVTAGALGSRFPLLREVGGAIGTGVSAAFLLAIAVANLFVLAAVHRSVRRVRDGMPAEDAASAPSTGQGPLTWIFRPLFRLISRSWHMYPLGFLFGLGFDTASEIGLLGIAAAEAAKGLPIWSILVFPALFTAGMALVDASDNVLMLGAYGWAMVRPVRKLYYNLAITFASVVIALAIGGIEALGLVAEKLGLEGGAWQTVAALNGSLGLIGCLSIALFAASWLAAMALYRLKGYHRLDGGG